MRQIADARARGRDDARPGVIDAVHRHGRLTARERLTALFDQESFVEYGALAGRTTAPGDEAFADGLVAGVGLVHGEPVVAASYDESVLGGTQSDRNHRKMAKLLYLAVEHRWPLVCFANGGGARLDDPLPPPPIAVSPRGRFDLCDGLAELNGWAPTVARQSRHTNISSHKRSGQSPIATACPPRECHAWEPVSTLGFPMPSSAPHA